MKLTGECKEDFEGWYKKEYPLELIFSQHNESLFRELPLSFKYGVYVDYFDSVGIYISVSPTCLEKWLMYPLLNKHYKIHIIGESISDYRFKTRTEARTKAIEKANEIRNDQLKQ